MIQALRRAWERWQAQREIEREERRYVEGFGWGIREYFLEGTSLDSMRDYTETAREYGEYNAFDEGLDAAIVLIEQHFANDFKKRNCGEGENPVK